jgi:hypothetical protein
MSTTASYSRSASMTIPAVSRVASMLWNDPTLTPKRVKTALKTGYKTLGAVADDFGCSPRRRRA